MFERFTDAARRVVVLAQDEARTLRHHYIGTEHLLLGVLGEEEGVAAATLRTFGLTVAAVRADVVRELASGGPPSDAEALRAIGIDLDVVRARVEESFGPGALEHAGHGCRRRRWRRRRGRTTAGHIPFTPRAKNVLELALREPLRLGDRHLGTEHILLGLLREGEGLAVQVLVERGVPPAHLRARLLAALGKGKVA